MNLFLNFDITFTEVFPWDIIAELVKLCTYPAPRNPFEIDFSYFEMLPVSEKVLATAAMVSVLQKIVMFTPDQKQYAGQGKDCLGVCFGILVDFSFRWSNVEYMLVEGSN